MDGGSLDLEGFKTWLNGCEDDAEFGHPDTWAVPINRYLKATSGWRYAGMGATDIAFSDCIRTTIVEPAPDWAIKYCYLLSWEKKSVIRKGDALRVLANATR